MKMIGTIATSMSGKLGGVVASHGRGGAYFRAKTIPTNPNTPRQIAVRTRIKNLAIAWANDLTQAQRDAWDLYAANVPFIDSIGESIFLTGINHYSRSNQAKLQAGLARVDDAPSTFTLAAAEGSLGATGSAAADTVDITFDDAKTWASEDNAAQLVFVGQPVNPSIKFFGGPFRFAGALLGNSTTPITSPQTLASPFVLDVGVQVFVETRILRADGRLSARARTSFLAGA